MILVFIKIFPYKFTDVLFIAKIKYNLKTPLSTCKNILISI